MKRRLHPRSALRRLRERAEAFTRGDWAALGQSVGGGRQVEELRQALDVLAFHVQQGQQTMHSLVGSLTSAQEAERGRLARELHDDTVQRLVVLTQRVDRIQRRLPAEPDAASAQLQELRGEIVGLVQSLRTLIADLRPPALAELGLRPALEFLLRTDGAELPLTRLEERGQPRRLDDQSELVVFRVVQEAWNNIRRHAQAHLASVTLDYGSAELIVTVADDGVGLRENLGDTARFGLLGMQERATLVGGAVEVANRAEGGTAVTLTVPYPGVAGRDLVCDMAVSPADLGVLHAGAVYRFCSPVCRDLFLLAPQRYIERLDAPPAR